MSGRAWGILLVLCGTIFIEGADVAMMGVALASIQSDLGMSTSALQWVVSGYVLGYGGFMLLGGRAADLLGRRRMFLGWLTVFLAFSGLGGFATEGWMLITARFMTGIAAAFMTPAGLSIITTRFPEGPARNKALLVYAGTGGAGFSLGLVVGGLLTAVDWRWVFFAPVLLSATLLLAAFRLIPADRDIRPTFSGFDLGGAGTITASMLLLVYAVVRAPEVAIAQTLGLGAASIAFMIAFVAIERRSATPLVRLGIFRSGALVRSNIAAMLFAGSFAGFQFLVVLYLQQVRGWSPLETGLALMIAGVDAVLAPTVTPKLVERFGTIRIIIVGTTLGAIGYGLFLRVGADSPYVSDMLPTMILIGLAFALAYGPLTIAATDGIAAGEQGLAGGILYTSWQFGSALGLAAVTAIKLTEADETSLDGFHAALFVPVVAVIASALVVSLGLRARRDPRARVRKFVPASD
jgi:MFS family permease